MSWLNKLERKLEPYAISNLTLYLVAAQTLVFIATMLGMVSVGKLVLVPLLAENGEWWRFFSFVTVPPASNPFFFAFAIYFLYFAGTALEEHWGTVRYNLFLLSGYLLTVAASLAAPGRIADNLFYTVSIILAFAYLNPRFTIYIFFILPVQIRWMALFVWAGYAYEFFTGGLGTKLAVLAATGNFFLFFGHSLWLDVKTGRRHMAQQAKRAADRRELAEPRHRCRICGKDSNSYPQLDFRYCSKCAGNQCYCPEHLANHEHVLSEENETN